MHTRLATLLLGLVQVVLGAALVLDLVSVRQLVRDTGVDVALLITVAARDSLRHAGAQVLEIALVVVGVALLARLARSADLGARWPRRAWVALALLAVGLAALTLHAPHAARLVGRLAAAGPAVVLPRHLPLAGAALSAPAQRPDSAGRRIEDGPGAAALSSATAPAERPAAEARAATVSLPIVRKQAATPPVVVQPASDAIPPPSGNPYALVPGQLRLAATFNSVGVELQYAGDANANGTATLEFRKAGEAEWRRGLPLWRVAGPSPAAYYGSVLLLEPGALYTVRVTLSDPDGVLGSAAVQATIATRAESIPPASALAPTHYVRAGGSDDADGRGPATAWRTIEKAFAAAPPGAVVQVGPGYYRAPRTVRTQPLDLVAQYPAVGDDGALINLGQRSVVEGGAVAAAGEGRWQQVALVGPATGRTYRVWRWARSGMAGATQLGYAATRADLPRRVAHWKAAGADLRTPAGWAEKLHTNLTYSYGFYVDGEDIYLRLPDDANPNDLYVSAGGGRGLRVNGPNVRISGFELRHFGEAVVFEAAATGGVVDHALFAGNLLGVSFRGAPGPPSVYGGDHVVERNVFRDSNLWSEDPAADPPIPWPFVKLYVKNADGSNYPFDRIGEQSESAAVGGRGGAQRVVVRYNVIDGTFNGLAPGEQADFDRYAGMDMDIHDNLIRNVADDAFEPERQSINLRIWRNRIERAAVVLSTGPVHYGPVYFFRNQAWRIGADGVGRDRLGDTGVASLYFKYSGSSQPTARIYVLHNTFWTDRPDVDGSGQFAGGGAASEAFYLRNNVVHATRYAFSAPTSEGRWDEDFNAFSTIDRTRGLRYGARFTTDVDAYRAASGQGAHTNLAGDFLTPPALRDPAAGDLAPPPDSPLVDAGTSLPNLSDRPGVDFQGAAPDLGALEAGGASERSTAPHAPPAPTPVPPSPTEPTPTPQPEPAPQPPAGFASSATVVPAVAASGETVSIAVDVTSPASLDAILYVGVFSPAGAEVLQRAIESPSLSTGQRATYRFSVPAPTLAGTYVIRLGVFSSPNARTLYHWNDSAGSFFVRAPARP